MKQYRRFLVIIFFMVLGVLVYHNWNYMFPMKVCQTEAVEDSLPAVSNEGDAERMVCPSGEPVGIYVKTKGVMVIGINDVETEHGQISSPCKDLLNAGDYIMRINGVSVNDKATLQSMVRESEGKELLFRVCRENQYRNLRITPVKTKQGVYAIGLWVKDDISGIGTITFTDGDSFAALGHSINDNDTGMMFRVSDGAIYDTSIVRIKKPAQNTPGRLEGIINYSGQYVIGRVEGNNAYGIHGYLTKRQQEKTVEHTCVPIGSKEDVHKGTAYLISSVSGESKQYEIEIVSVDTKNESGKCMEFRVTDTELLALTGGIVQGMSGTPILQDGKLIGAVTHVFVEDSKRGYGIFIGSMLEH